MKISILLAGVPFLLTMPFAHAGPASDPTHDPCFRVTIQNDRVNESDVKQNCDRNVSRTAQVGVRNRAQTVQSGSVNNNKVRQYHFDRSKYFGQMRRD